MTIQADTTPKVRPQSNPNEPTHGINRVLWRDLPEPARRALELDQVRDKASRQQWSAYQKGEQAHGKRTGSQPSALATNPKADSKRYGERTHALALGFPESRLALSGQPYPWATVYQFVAAKRETLSRLEREEAARIAALPPLRRIWINIVDDGTPPDDALEARADERAANLERTAERAASRRERAEASRREEQATEAEAERKERAAAIAAKREEQAAAAADRADRNLEIRQRVADGETQAALALEYGLNRSTVSRIVRKG